MRGYAKIPVAFWACYYILLATAALSRDTHTVQHLHPNTFWETASNVAQELAPKEWIPNQQFYMQRQHNINKVCSHKHTVTLTLKLLHCFEITYYSLYLLLPLILYLLLTPVVSAYVRTHVARNVI